MRRRVVITGMGVVTPLGHSVDELFRSQIEGKSGVRTIQNLNASGFPTTFAAEVKNFDLKRSLSGSERWEHSGVNSQFAAVATQQAMQDAGLLGLKGVDATRVGVY